MHVAELHTMGTGMGVCCRQRTAEVLFEEMPGAFDVVACMEMLGHVLDQAVGSVNALTASSVEYRSVAWRLSTLLSRNIDLSPSPRAGKLSVSGVGCGGVCRSRRALPNLACRGLRRCCGAGGRLDLHERASGGAPQGGDRVGSAGLFLLSMWVRISFVTAGASMQAMIRSAPPQAGQVSISMPRTRLRRRDHVV